MNPHSYDIGSSGCLVADQRVVSSPYPALLKAALTSGDYAELLHMYAMSAVLDEQIQSYFPPTSSNETLSSAYKVIISSRQVKTTRDSICCLMWSCTSMPKMGYCPNHFVPLIPIDGAAEPTSIVLNDSDCGSCADDGVSCWMEATAAVGPHQYAA